MNLHSVVSLQTWRQLSIVFAGKEMAQIIEKQVQITCNRPETSSVLLRPTEKSLIIFRDDFHHCPATWSHFKFIFARYWRV